jgi:hypothetical protein
MSLDVSLSSWHLPNMLSVCFPMFLCILKLEIWLQCLVNDICKFWNILFWSSCILALYSSPTSVSTRKCCATEIIINNFSFDNSACLWSMHYMPGTRLCPPQGLSQLGFSYRSNLRNFHCITLFSECRITDSQGLNYSGTKLSGLICQSSLPHFLRGSH